MGFPCDEFLRNHSKGLSGRFYTLWAGFCLWLSVHSLPAMSQSPYATRQSCRRFWAPILSSRAPCIGSLHIGLAQIQVSQALVAESTGNPLWQGCGLC